MYIIISDKTYRRVRALTYAPEVDLTLATLPINGFRADIITGDDIPVGGEARLYDDMGRLWAAYRVMKAEQMDGSTVRVVAQSELALLDRWEVGAEMFQNVTVRNFVERLFQYPPASGSLYRDIQIDIDSFFSGVTVTGFCPRQTARQRLQWLCLTVGALVRQCFCERLTLISAPDVDAATYYAPGALIPLSDTFWKPSLTTRDIVRTVAVTGYANFTTNEPGGDGLVWKSGVDQYGVKWYFNPIDWMFDNDDVPERPGSMATIDGVTLISGDAAAQVLGWLASAYFRIGEIRADVVNNGQYYPGMKVRVYADEQTVYTGYIRACDFSFGVQARSRLVIASDLERVSTGTLSFAYRFGDIPIGRNAFVLPAFERYDVPNPVISWYEGPRYVEYVPVTPRSAGETPPGSAETVVQYVQRLPDHMEIITPPTRIQYTDGDPLSYAGLIVKVYDADGEPWTQGGLFVDGVIPMRYLTLPEKRANIQSADRSRRQSDLNILPSIAPVSVGTYSSMNFNESHWLYPAMRVQWEYLIEGGFLTANVHLNPDGTAKSFFRYIFASESPNTRFEERITQVNGQVAADRFYTIGADKSYTHAGKKVYYKPVFSSNAYSDNDYVGPITNYTEMTSASPVGATAWTMLYGEVIEGDQRIPVRWHVPGTDQILECAFSVTVRARGLTEEAEP